MDKFDLGIAATKVEDFAWSEFCDWYIEIVKPRLYGEDKEAKQTALYVLTYVLEKILKIITSIYAIHNRRNLLLVYQQ